MFIRFQKKQYELPDPIAMPDEVTVHVKKSFVFPQPVSVQENRFRFSHTPAKLLFFLIREGIALTVRKIRSSLLQRKILAERRVVLAYGTLLGGDSHTVAIGPQHCPEASVQTFPLSWSVPVSHDYDIATCRDMLLSHFDAYPGLFDEIFHFSPFSGREVRFALNELINHKTTTSGPSRQAKAPVEFLVPASSSPGDGVPARRMHLRERAGNDLFLVGAGAYAFAYILPFLRGVRHHTVVDLNPALAAVAAGKFDFAFADTSFERALERLSESASPRLVVATYHSTHVDIAKKAVEVNPETKIFLEKPPVTSLEALETLLSLRMTGAFIEIGFNRRYSPIIRKARELIYRQSGPVVLTCIVKELALPASHWYYWPTQGTRITGNLCHWLDLGVFLIGRPAVAAMIVAPPDHPPGNEITVVVHFEDGSRLTVVATDQGNQLRGVQEMIDIRRGDLTIVIDDFHCMRVQENGRYRIYRRLHRDKGHHAMYREFIENVAGGERPQYPDGDLSTTSRLYLALTNAARSGEHMVSESQL
ncbi:MAG: Gfo/Idh/MocA family protein [Syntrophobacteraceae bacterium]